MCKILNGFWYIDIKLIKIMAKGLNKIKFEIFDETTFPLMQFLAK